MLAVSIATPNTVQLLASLTPTLTVNDFYPSSYYWKHVHLSTAITKFQGMPKGKKEKKHSEEKTESSELDSNMVQMLE